MQRVVCCPMRCQSDAAIPLTNAFLNASGLDALGSCNGDNCRSIPCCQCNVPEAHRAFVSVLAGGHELSAVAQQRCKVLLDAHADLLLASLAIPLRLNGPRSTCRMKSTID